MHAKVVVDVIIPVLNEQNAVGQVIAEIPKNLIRQVIVVDNGSTDDTINVARQAGAVVLEESSKGYGSACLKGMDFVSEHEIAPDVVVFIDGDHSDYPEQMTSLLDEIRNNGVQLVIGSRTLGIREAGSMTVPQLFGNWLATFLLRMLYGVKFTDLGPFRAITYPQLLQMDMQDKTYGWTVEMQAKAAKLNVKVSEVPVNYRNRIGVSKISGTVKGTILAGYKIIHTIFKYW